MMPDEVPSGPWEGRVRFGPGGGFAYRPNEVLVHQEIANSAERRLDVWNEDRRRRDEEPIHVERHPDLVAGEFTRFQGEFEPREIVDVLHSAGIPAQFDHVLFSTGCCPPHPADPRAEAFYGANGVTGDQASLVANPYYASPYYASPFGLGACGCPCPCPSWANPYYASPYYASPYYASADPSPFVAPWLQRSGFRRSSARPADPPVLQPGKAATGVRVAILDTGWAGQAYVPDGLPGISVSADEEDLPDRRGDDLLDPVAGHGTFIAGIIEQLAPECDLELIRVLSEYGDGSEDLIANELFELAQRPDETCPQVVNLSFGGYSPLGMWALAHAVSTLHDRGVAIVASAGNDATCIPMYPAALPNVVSIGALDGAENAAPFTNYGPWVDACAEGVDLESIFFKGFNGAEPRVDGYDPDDFYGWAKWSGTSFAAPRVVAALAQLVADGYTPHDAVDQLINDPNLPRKPMLGTVVNPN